MNDRLLFGEWFSSQQTGTSHTVSELQFWSTLRRQIAPADLSRSNVKRSRLHLRSVVAQHLIIFPKRNWAWKRYRMSIRFQRPLASHLRPCTQRSVNIHGQVLKLLWKQILITFLVSLSYQLDVGELLLCRFPWGRQNCINRSNCSVRPRCFPLAFVRDVYSGEAR